MIIHAHYINHPAETICQLRACLHATTVAAAEIKGSKTEGAGIMLVESFGLDPLGIRTAAFANGIGT